MAFVGRAWFQTLLIGSRMTLDTRSRKPTDSALVIRHLHERGIRWVLAGDAAPLVFGFGSVAGPFGHSFRHSPRPNLERLARVLESFDAIPARRRHMAWMTLRRLPSWSADPVSPKRLDRLFVTTAGLIEIVPHQFGSVEELVPSAATVEVEGVRIVVRSSGGRANADVAIVRSVNG